MKNAMKETAIENKYMIVKREDVDLMGQNIVLICLELLGLILIA
jgi:hypothetical protein